MDIIKRMAREMRERLDPMEKAERAKAKKRKESEFNEHAQCASCRSTRHDSGAGFISEDELVATRKILDPTRRPTRHPDCDSPRALLKGHWKLHIRRARNRRAMRLSAFSAAGSHHSRRTRKICLPGAQPGWLHLTLDGGILNLMIRPKATKDVS